MENLKIKNEDWKEEKINGEIYLMSPSANPKHGNIISNLILILKSYFKNKPCAVFGDNLDVYFTEDEYIIPDISIICDPNKLKDDGYHGAPTLMVEIISPSSFKRDTEQKPELFKKYKVPEFWLIDYNNKFLKQYTLVGDEHSDVKTWILLDKHELKRLSKEDKDNYTTKFKSSAFPDLEIDLKDVFNPIFRV